MIWPENSPGFVSRTCLRVSTAWLSWVLSGQAIAVSRDGGVDPSSLGKGDWIYSLADATNGLGGHFPFVTNEVSLMQFYRSQGIRFLVVKAATSDQLFKGCFAGPQFTRALVETAHTNGLWIFGYNRSYGSNIPGEIAVANYVFNQGADGFVWDAEAEWENTSPWIGSTGPAKAWHLCSTVRSNWPTRFLAHAPFPIISYHPSFPYKEFGYWCDAVMPQIYHSGWTGVVGRASGGINWSDVNWSTWHKSLVNSNSVIQGTTVFWTNAIKPLAPVAEVYGPSRHSPCAGVTTPLNATDLGEFLDYLSVDPHSPSGSGYQGVSFWRSDLHGTAQWQHIKEAVFGGVQSNVSSIVLDDARGCPNGAWTAVRTFYNGTVYSSGSGRDVNSFGTNYLVRPHGNGEGFVEFSPVISVAGDYDLYQWHPFRPDASSRVPFVVSGDNHTNFAYANQQTNAGSWSLVGRFGFASGTNSVIRITDATAETNTVSIVDGLKLVPVPKSLP